MQRCSVMNPIIRRICKLIRGRKSSAEGMTELGFEWWTGVRHVGGRRIAQVGNSKFKEHPREQGTLREQGRVHYATTHCLPSGPLVSHFPGSEGRESACSAGDSGSVPGSGRSPGEGNGNPPQYSLLNILAWRIPWAEEPGRLQSMRSQRVGHDRAIKTFTFTFLICYLLCYLIYAMNTVEVAHDLEDLVVWGPPTPTTEAGTHRWIWDKFLQYKTAPS